MTRRKREPMSEGKKNMSDKSKNIHTQIIEYLAELFSKGTLTEEQSTQTAGLMYILDDVERLNLLCDEILTSLEIKANQKKQFSEDAVRELCMALKEIHDMYYKTIYYIDFAGSGGW